MALFLETPRLLLRPFTERDAAVFSCYRSDPENTASGRLLRKVGMRHEGRFVESLWFKGGWASEDWYAILRQEWQANANR